MLDRNAYGYPVTAAKWECETGLSLSLSLCLLSEELAVVRVVEISAPPSQGLFHIPSPYPYLLLNANHRRDWLFNAVSDGYLAVQSTSQGASLAQDYNLNFYWKAVLQGRTLSLNSASLPLWLYFHYTLSLFLSLFLSLSLSLSLYLFISLSLSVCLPGCLSVFFSLSCTKPS